MKLREAVGCALIGFGLAQRDLIAASAIVALGAHVLLSSPSPGQGLHELPHRSRA